MKDTDHFLTGVPFTSAVNGSIEEHRGCARRDIQFGRGQNTGVGWSDPTFGGFQPPKDFVGSLQKKVRIAHCTLRSATFFTQRCG
jgi:hypothetical protein